MKTFKIFFFLLIVSKNLVSSGYENSPIQNKYSKNELFFRIDPNHSLLTDKGVEVDCGNIGKITLSNIKFDKKGCYAPIEFTIHCANCDAKRDLKAICCTKCHDDKQRRIAKIISSDRTFSELLNQIDVNDVPLILQELDEISVSGGIDSEGNKSVEGKYEHDSEDGSSSGYVTGEITQDEEGEIKGEVRVGWKWNF